MRHLLIVLSAVMLLAGGAHADSDSRFGLVLHGGAGTIKKENMTAEVEAEYRAKLEEALNTGYGVLESGGSSVDAVTATLNVLEDSPMFNAGKGAVFTAEGTNEMDASIMDGRDLNAGAVAGVKRIRNPIDLARLVMDESKHVMLSGEGAETFARQHGVETADADYFHTDHRWKQLKRVQDKEEKEGFEFDKEESRSALPLVDEDKFGTVGAAALDKDGNLAAGTSTGGMTNKRFGRIGDSPIVGAGTYANNKTAAISATGHGEYFIRANATYDISALMEYKGLSLKKAAEKVVKKKLVDMGGAGGVIAIDSEGNVAMPFNTAGMYRGFRLSDSETVVRIFR